MNRKGKKHFNCRWGLMMLSALWTATGATATARDFSTAPDNRNESAREIPLNRNWKFNRGECPQASEKDFDDTSWRTLNLPHDWSIEGRPEANEPSGNDGGYYPAGSGWYRKTFRFTPDSLKPATTILFDGVYQGAEVYVNGEKAGGRPYGYSAFSIDISQWLKKGDNTLAVHVDNSRQKNCRWYSGSGIYREVRLIRTPEVHFTPWGIDVQTERIMPNGNGARTALLRIRTTLRNKLPKDTTLAVVAHIRIGEGRDYTVVKRATIGAGATMDVVQQVNVKIGDSLLWSPDSPVLFNAEAYTAAAHTAVSSWRPEPEYDHIGTEFGIRSISLSPDEGLVLNGKPLELNGGCLHHDNGCLGAAAWKDAEWRKARLMKEAGFNAVRTAHNPPSEEFLNACDHIGLLVIDEAFDGWRTAKNTHDYASLFDKWWLADIESMVRRDRRHPSIFCWSIGNEIIERKSPEAVITANALAGAVRRLDESRPVTSALAAWDSDWEIYDPLAAAHDITGYNYMIHKAESDHLRVPERIMMQTESYPRDAFANWTKVNDLPYVIGDFVWTAVDYLGESGIGRFYYKGETEGEHYHRPQYPWHGAYCGDIDLTGWRKPISHYREILYSREEKLYMAVKEPNGYRGEIKETQWSVWPTWESWNWPGHEGKDIDVEIYSRFPAVRLYLNDRLIDEKATGREQEFKAVFRIPYQAGVLRATGVKDGRECESMTIATAGKPYAIRLKTDRTEMKADGESLAFITAEIIDRLGRTVPDADNLIEFSTDGHGRLLATCSADLKDCVPYTSAQRKTWKGRAMAVIQSIHGQKGRLKIKVRGKGLKTASLTIDCKD